MRVNGRGGNKRNKVLFSLSTLSLKQIACVCYDLLELLFEIVEQKESTFSKADCVCETVSMSITFYSFHITYGQLSFFCLICCNHVQSLSKVNEIIVHNLSHETYSGN